MTNKPTTKTGESNPPIEKPSPHEILRMLRGDGQPWLFVDLAVTIASSADVVRQILSWFTRTSKPPQLLPPPPALAEWLPFYRSHRALQAGIGSYMGLSADCTNSTLDELRGMHRVPEDQLREELAKFDKAELESIIRPFIGVPFPPDDATIKAMLPTSDDNGQPSGDDGKIDALLASPAGQFYFRVWLPCWLFYREFPPRLLHLARGGDLNALDKLLRLDKSVIHDPRIAQRVHEITHTGSKRDRDQVLEALRCEPKGRLDPKTIRYGLAGMISQLAVVFQTRVTAPEIAALFDAIERVRTGKPADTRIAAGETFSKAVQRNRTWPSLPKS